jgi:hypothetical protein
MMAIGSVFEWPSVRARHSDAPLLREREQFLQHLLQQGTRRFERVTTNTEKCSTS